MTSKDDIITALPQLTQAELEVVHGLCSHLLKAAHGLSPAQVTGAHHPFFDALVTAVGQSMPYSQFALTAAATHFDVRVKNLTDYLNLNFKGWDENKTTQLAFLAMLFRLLADDLKNRGVKPTLGVMVINLRRIPEVFDSQFPNYRETGMCHVILDRFKAKGG